MATSYGVGGAIAGGIQSGFEMGRQVDLDADRRTQIARENARTDRLDTERTGQIQRANTREDEADALSAVNAEMSDHAVTGAGLSQQYGGMDKIPADVAAQYTKKAQDIGARRSAVLQQKYAPVVQKEQQWAQDTASRIATGQLSMDDLSPADTVRLLQATANRPVGDLLRPRAPEGMTEPGNIDLTNRPHVKNADGSVSTVRSLGVNVDGKEVLIPTVSDGGRVMSNDEAIDTYRKTGKHLGKFTTPAASTAYAQRLHTDQAALLASGNSKVGQGVADTMAGIQTQNHGLVVQGANTLLQPEIEKGVGHVAPDGSTITGKRITALLPAPAQPDAQPAANPVQGLSAALDLATGTAPGPTGNVSGGQPPQPGAQPGGQLVPQASGQPAPQPGVEPGGQLTPQPGGQLPPQAPQLSPGTDPNKVIPVLQVTAQHPDGTEVTYHAPVTADRSTDPNATVAPAFSMSSAMDRVGRLSTLEAWANTPAARAKIEQGLKEMGGDANSFPSAYAAMHGNADALLTPDQRSATGQKITAIKALAKSEGVTFEEAARMLVGRPTTGLQAKLDAIDDDDSLSTGEKADARRVAVGIAKVGKTGLVGAKGGGASGGVPGTSTALGGVAAPDPKTAPDATVEFWARAVIAGDKDWQVGLSRSKSGSALIEAVKRRVPGLASEMHLQPQDIGTARAQSAALSSTLKDLTKRQAAVDLFSSKVEKDMATMESVLDKASTGSPLLISEPINVLRRKFSDTSLAQLDLAAKQVGTEYERLITGGSLSVAQLHQGASEDAKKLINGDMPPAQARAVMRIMRVEIGNARTAASESTARIQNQMRALGTGPLGSVTQPSAPPPARSGTGLGAAPAPGAPAAGTVMQGFRFKGGNPADKTNWERVQ